MISWIVTVSVGEMSLEESIEWKEESQNEIAIRDGKECIDVARNTGDKHAEMKATLLVAEENLVLKHYDEAIQYAVRSVDIAKETGDKQSELRACLVLGKANQALEQYDEAIKYVKTSLDIAKEIGDEHTEIRACALQQYYKLSQEISSFLLISFLFDSKQDDEANQCAKICLDILNKETDSWMTVKTLSVALANFNFNEHDDAIKYARKCLEISSGDESQEFEKEVYFLLAKSHKSLNQYEDAVLYFEVARRIAEENKDKDIEMMACASIYKIYGKLNQYEETIKYAKMWVDITNETDSQEQLMEVYSILWLAHSLLGQYESALTYCKQHLDIAKQVGDKHSEMTACLGVGHIYKELHQCSEAVSHYKRAMDISIQTRDKHAEEEACLGIGIVYLVSKQYNDAIKYANIYLKMENKTDSNNHESTAYSLLFEAYKQLGQYEKVLSCTMKGFELYQKKEEKDNKPHVEFPDKHKEAVVYWKRCADIAIEVRDKEKLMISYLRLGETYFNSYQYDDSLLYYKKTADIARETGDKDTEMTVCLQLAQIDLLLNQNEEGMLYAKKALEIAKEFENKKAEIRAYSLLLRLSSSANNSSDFFCYATQFTAITKEAGDSHEEILGSAMELKISSNKTEKHEYFFDKCMSVAVNPPNLPSEQLMQHVLFYFHFYLRTMLFFGNYDPVLTLMICEDGARRYQLSIPLPTVSSFFNTCNEKLKFQPASDQEKPYLVRLRDFYEQEVQTRHQMKNVVSFENMTHYFQESLNWFLICFIAYGLVADQAICHSCSGIIHYVLGNPESAKKSFGESIKCFECVFDRLHELDKSKISIVDRYVETYKLLSKVLIEEDQKEEALLVSERCRARALNEVLSLEYGMKGQVDQSVINLTDIHSFVSTNKFAMLIFSHCFMDLHTFVIKHAKELQLSIQSFGLHSMSELQQYIIDQDTKDSNCGMFSLVEEILSVQGVELGSEASKEVDKIVQKALFEITNPDLSTANEQTEAGAVSEATSPLEMLHEILLGRAPIDQDEIVIIPDGPLFRVPFAALRNPSTGRYLSQDKKIRLAPSLATLKLLSECPADFHMLTGALVIGDPQVGKVMQDGVERDIPSLESAQVEALVIASKFGVDPLIGPQATKRDVIEKLKQGASVVHIAAHGSLSKATILLAPTPEIRQAKTLPDEEDYMLTMADVQQARIRAQLVVLSCCYSGRGEIRAEGVVGMCRAFLASGARAVVASLWDVNDNATLEFMSYFYHNLEYGESASTSLQMAMDVVRQNEQFSTPKYWAPFFLMGDDVTIKL